MEYKKITISLPERMYNEAQALVEKGVFANISDLIRSGIRHEFKEMQPIMNEMDELMDRDLIYADKELIKGVKTSRLEARKGKGKTFKDSRRMENYLNSP